MFTLNTSDHDSKPRIECDKKVFNMPDWRRGDRARLSFLFPVAVERMSSKGNPGAKSGEKGNAKTGSAKSTGKEGAKSTGNNAKATGKSSGAKSTSSGSAKASSSSSHSSNNSNSKTQPNNHGKDSSPRPPAPKKTSKPAKPKFEAAVSSSSKKQADNFEMYGDDISVEVTKGNSRQQALGRRPRMRKVSPTIRKATVGISGNFQDRLLKILKSSPWSPLTTLEPSASPTLEENIAYFVNDLGFRRFEVLQALQYAKNHTQLALEWLAIHVPNEYLPTGFRSAAAAAKIQVMDISSAAHQRKRMARRLESYGFLKSQSQRELEITEDNETLALCNLLESFLTADAVSTMRRVRRETPEMSPEYIAELQEMRDSEIEMLKSIMGEEGEISKVSDSLIKITLPITVRPQGGDPKNINIKLEVHIPADNHYPHELPLFGMQCDEYKSEVIYAFTRKLVVEANQNAGMQLIYTVITWIQQTAPRTLPSLAKTFEDPEKCADAHTKYGKTLKESAMEKEALKQVKKDIKNSSAESTSSSAANAEENESSEDVTKLMEALKSLNMVTIEEMDAQIEKPKPRSAAEQKRVEEKSKQLADTLNTKRSEDAYRKMLAARSQLPAFQYRTQVLDLLATSKGPVALISGATGCGKTTQVAQILMDDMIDRGLGGECNILVTQPRRLSAVSVAERVAAERCESIGETVGYSIRLEAKRSESTQILFMTTGVLLRRLQSDPLLKNVSHVIVDEVHERDLNSDFLLIILKKVIERRAKFGMESNSAFGGIKLILMSATLNAANFAAYFNDCPTLEIPGRTFPVQSWFLEDAIEHCKYTLDARSPYATGGRKFKLYEGYSVQTSNVMAILNRKKINYELIWKMVDHVFEKYANVEGGILVFLPGMAEISQFIDTLSSSSQHSRKMTILPLHSSLSTEQQQKVFKKAPHGTRKVVVSTNVAETSVTVEDIVFVIDSCKVKETRYDGNVESLVEDWTSKASIRQRMGRAGRVRAGFCWSLVSTSRHVHLPDFQEPEIRRVPLDSLVLTIRVLKMGNPKDFLKLALDPPSEASVQSAVKELQDINALDEKEHLTPLGYHLGSLPVAPKIGKMLIYASIFKCLSPILTICAALSDRAPFNSTVDNRDDAEDAKSSWDLEDGYSDHLAIVRAYDAWEAVCAKGSDNSFCRENFLSKPTLINMRDLRKQFREILKSAGFAHALSYAKEKTMTREEKEAMRKAPGGDDANSADLKIVKAILCAGLYPNIAHLRPIFDTSGGITSTRIVTRDGEEVFIHPSSILAKMKKFPGNFLVFHDRVKTSRIFLRDVTVISNYSALLFGGKIEVYPEDQVLEIDDWISFQASGREAILLSKLRQEIDKLLLEKVADTTVDISNKPLTSLAVSLLKSEADMHVI